MMIMIMIIMVKTNIMKTMIKSCDNDAVKDNDGGRHDDEDAWDDKIVDDGNDDDYVHCHDHYDDD